MIFQGGGFGQISVFFINLIQQTYIINNFTTRNTNNKWYFVTYQLSSLLFHSSYKSDDM